VSTWFSILKRELLTTPGHKGFIPLSQSFVLRPSGGNSYVWIANLIAGTSVSFSVVDAQGRVGGTSNTRVVQRTDNTSCFGPSSPSPSGLTPSISSPHSPTDSNYNDSSMPSKTGLIVGLAVGGCALVAIICILAFFCLRKRSRESGVWPPRQKHAFDLTYDPVGAPAPGPTGYLLPDHYTSTPFPAQSDGFLGLTTTMYNDPRHSQTRQSDSHISIPLTQNLSHAQSPPPIPSLDHSEMGSSQPSLVPVPYNYMPAAFNTPEPRPSKPSHQNQRSSAQTTPHVIVHTDISESTMTIELPPQYSEHRTPIPGFSTSEASTSSSRKRG
jgi:hypothetical protein